MRQFKTFIIALIGLLVLQSGVPAGGIAAGGAGDRPTDQNSGRFLGGQWSLGVRASYATSPYKDGDDEIMPYPDIGYEGERLFIHGPAIGLALFEFGWVSTAVVCRYRFDGYDEDEGDYLQGMDQREDTLEAGLQIELETVIGEFELSLMADTLGRHEGWEVELAYAPQFQLGRFAFQPSAGVIWQSDGLANYYYGVKTSEARAGRSAYEVDAGFNYQAELEISFALTPHWSLLAEVEGEWFRSEIADSPIVADDVQTAIGFGLSYTF